MSAKRKSAGKSKHPDGVLDFETDPFKHGRVPRPFAGCVYFGPNDFHVFWDSRTCAADMAAFIGEMPKCTLWAHNGGKFDFHYLLEFAEPGHIEIRNGRITKMKIGRVTLRDSYPLIPIPLAAYKKTPIDYRKFERRRRDKNRDEITRYLIDDCRDLLDLLTGFRAVVGEKVFTVGAAAFKSIKECGYKIETGNERHDAIFRPYFFGGRCEVMMPGVTRGPLEYVDINSAYPFAMLSQHPVGVTPADWVERDDMPDTAGPWFARIRAVSNGCLPARGEDGILDYHHDNTPREYHATGWEVVAGIETGTLRVLEVVQCWEPVRTRDFSVYVKKHWKNRQTAKKTGDKVKEIAYKFLLNSGYGKWAQNPANFKKWKLTEFDEYGGDDWVHQTDIGERSIWCAPASSGGNGYYNVAVAASITGYVRAMLWRAICASDGVIYCDTDSMVCRRARVPRGDKLGEWKLVGKVKRAVIAGRKMYALSMADGERITASKGVKLTGAQIERVANGEAVKWEGDAPSFHPKRAGTKKHARFAKRTIKRR